MGRGGGPSDILGVSPPPLLILAEEGVHILDTAAMDTPLGDADPASLEILADLGRRLLPRLEAVAREFGAAGSRRLPKDEVRHLERISGETIRSIIAAVAGGSLERARDEVIRLARSYAHEELPLGRVMLAIHLYKETLLGLLSDLYGPGEDLGPVLRVVERFFHGVLINITVSYFSSFNQRLLQIRWGLEKALQLINATNFAMEEASAKLGLQDLIIPMVIASRVKYMREETGADLDLPPGDVTALEVCRAYIEYIRELGINPNTQHVMEEMKDGVRVTVDDKCFHASRCRQQQERGIPVACMRASGMEMALNWKLESPYVATDKDLKPGESCTFCLRRVL